jgi:flagellar basal body P-ring formation protein FlgA
MGKVTKYILTVWLIIAGSLGSPQPCWADATVVLRGESEVRRMAVRLSDVFNGIPSSIDEDIAQAPSPGKQVIYDINVLTRLANKYHLDWKPQSLADHVVITTACTHITIESIRDAVIKKMRADNADTVKKDSEIDVVLDNHALEIDLPADQTPDFTLNNFDYDASSRHFRADIFAETLGGPYTVPVTGRVMIKQKVPVLAKRLSSGTILSASDIDWVSIDEEHVNASVITDSHQLVGRELRRDLAEGEMFRTHDIIQARFVTRGSIVTMSIETPVMQVTAQGRALQDGTEGEVVRLINTQSNRVVEGTVTGPQTVLIHAGQKVAAVE